MCWLPLHVVGAVGGHGAAASEDACAAGGGDACGGVFTTVVLVSALDGVIRCFQFYSDDSKRLSEAEGGPCCPHTPSGLTHTTHPPTPTCYRSQQQQQQQRFDFVPNMEAPTSSLPLPEAAAQAPPAPAAPAPDNESSDSSEDEGDLLEELWPRETKPLLNYQVRPAGSPAACITSPPFLTHLPPFPP